MFYDGYQYYYNPDELYHHGIKGMKWGQRRFQNPDGSLTSKGKQRYGIAERTKIRVRGAFQDLRSTANNVRNAKGAGNKASELFGYGRMRTHQANAARVEEKLSKASRTRLGKAIHNQKSSNAKHLAKYSETMRHKSAGEKVFENMVLRKNLLKTPYTRLSGRTTTYGMEVASRLLTGGLYSVGKDIEYLADKKAKKN